MNKKEAINRIAELKSRQNPVVLNNNRIPKLMKKLKSNLSTLKVSPEREKNLALASSDNSVTIFNANTGEASSFNATATSKLENSNEIRVTIGSQRLARRSSLGVSMIKPFAERSTVFKMPQIIGGDMQSIHDENQFDSMRESIDISSSSMSRIKSVQDFGASNSFRKPRSQHLQARGKNSMVSWYKINDAEKNSTLI